MVKSKKNTVTLTKKEVEKVGFIVADAIENLKDTLMLALNSMIVKDFPAEKVKEALKLADKLVDIS